MRMHRDDIFHYARLGQMSLMVAQLPITSDAYNANYPDAWFERLYFASHRLSVGDERGCLYLSPLGWNKNKDRIREVFESVPPDKRGTWTEFEKFAKDHFHYVLMDTWSYIRKTSQHIEHIVHQVGKRNIASLEFDQL